MGIGLSYTNGLSRINCSMKQNKQNKKTYANTTNWGKLCMNLVETDFQHSSNGFTVTLYYHTVSPVLQ